jgi:hypothetical protein
MNKIDAIEIVRKIRDKHYEETKTMNQKEKLEYIRKKAKELEKHTTTGNYT